MPNSSSEEVLVAQCRAGLAGAWEVVFARHYRAVARFVYTLLPGSTEQDVEEVCQETFIAAIRHIATFQGRSQLQTWLFRIASNKARDFRDYQQALKRGGGTPPISLQALQEGDRPDLEPPADTPTPDQWMVQHETTHEVQRALDDLGDACRQIIELRYFGELDYDSIGEALGLHSKTVSSRLSRCLDKLGTLLVDAREHARRPAP